MMAIFTTIVLVWFWVSILRLIWPGASADITFWVLIRFILALIWMLPVWFLFGAIITISAKVGA